MDLTNILSSPKRVLHHSSTNIPPQPSAAPSSEDEAKENLLNAINSATEPRVRAILRKLCMSRPEVYEFVSNELLLKQGELGKRVRGGQDQDRGPSGYIQDSDYSDEDGDGDAGSGVNAGAGGKRSRQRFEICGQCKNEYDVMQNGEKSCRWHNGRSEIDDEFWVDSDEELYELNTPQNRKDFPEGFKWSCCGKLENGKACTISVHRPDCTKRVRT